MLKEMELRCDPLRLVRARANKEQSDGELAEKAGRLAPASHEEQNTLASQHPQRGVFSHPEFNKHTRAGARRSVAPRCVVLQHLCASTASSPKLLCLPLCPTLVPTALCVQLPWFSFCSRPSEACSFAAG